MGQRPSSPKESKRHDTVIVKCKRSTTQTLPLPVLGVAFSFLTVREHVRAGSTCTTLKTAGQLVHSWPKQLLFEDVTGLPPPEWLQRWNMRPTSMIMDKMRKDATGIAFFAAVREHLTELTVNKHDSKGECVWTPALFPVLERLRLISGSPLEADAAIDNVHAELPKLAALNLRNCAGVRQFVWNAKRLPSLQHVALQSYPNLLRHTDVLDESVLPILRRVDCYNPTQESLAQLTRATGLLALECTISVVDNIKRATTTLRSIHRLQLPLFQLRLLFCGEDPDLWAACANQSKLTQVLIRRVSGPEHVTLKPLVLLASTQVKHVRLAEVGLDFDDCRVLITLAANGMEISFDAGCWIAGYTQQEFYERLPVKMRPWFDKLFRGLKRVERPIAPCVTEKLPKFQLR